MARRALIVAVLGTCALAPATATAGSYDVYSCKVGSAFYGNNAWAGANNAGAGDPAFTAPKTTCANGSDPLVALMRPAAAGATVAYATPAPASSALHLDAPANTRITDFALTLRHWFSTPSNVGFNLLQFGTKGVSLAGAWDSTPAGDRAAINAEGHLYGAGAAVDSGSVTITKAGLSSGAAPRLGAIDRPHRGLLDRHVHVRPEQHRPTAALRFASHDRGRPAARHDGRPSRAGSARRRLALGRRADHLQRL